MGPLLAQRSRREQESRDRGIVRQGPASWAAETELAITAARGAYKAWAATPVSAREAIFFRAADVLAAKTNEIVDVLIQESGSIAGKAGFEVGFCFDLLRTAAAEMRRSPGETMPLTAPGQFGFAVRQPLGVIAGIAPFNAPFLLAMKKVVLALAAGNGFILKPSELTPVTGLKIAEVFDEAGLPPGLLSVVPGLASEVGAAIFADPRVRMITFTGSTQTGRHLAVEAAKTLKRFTLEMGGKSPLIVLGDADVDYAVRAAAFGIFFHQGQVCMANPRILVEEPIFDAFCERFVAVAKSLKVGELSASNPAWCISTIAPCPTSRTRRSAGSRTAVSVVRAAASRWKR
jgi:vanillin dehydrogenase